MRELSSARREIALRAAVLAVALGGYALRALDTATVYNHTFDEPTQIASGLELLQYGRFELHVDVPPLAKVLMAAPLYAGGARLAEPPRRGDPEAGNRFIYAGNGYAGKLRAARAVSTAMGVLLLFALYAAALEIFGSIGACVAVCAASVSPGLVSAASIANSDVLGVLTVLAALWTFRRLLEDGSRRRAAVFAVAAALAIATKLSAVPFLIFGLPVVAAFVAGRRTLAALRHPLAWLRVHWSSLALVAGVMVAVVWATYGFHFAHPAGEEQARVLAERLQPRWPALAALATRLAATELPLGGFVRGLAAASNISRWGHPAYFMGQQSLHGFAAYFPVTLLLKVPLGLLAAAACALALAWRQRQTERGRDVLLCFALSAAVLLSVMNAGVNAGHRHVVVVEALLALAAAGGVALALAEPGFARPAWLAVTSVAVAAGMVASVRAHPDALGYTNALAGKDPDWWFADSNLDWGQDLDRLARFLAARGVREPIHLAYFGTADPARHGVRAQPLLPGQHPAGWVAVSVEYLRGLYGARVGQLPTPAERDGFAWLLRIPETARIGTSMRVYHLAPGEEPGVATAQSGGQK